LSPPRPDLPSERLLQSLHAAGLPAADRPTTFREPWQAQAFALVVALADAGLFDWPEWVARFSAEIRARPQERHEDSETAYYRQWLATLERIIVERDACAPDAIDRRQADWRQAYLHTPHGQAVALENAHLPCPERHDHDHHHAASPGPIAVSRAAAG
jgi:nitrile hydratase accessory protein